MDGHSHSLALEDGQMMEIIDGTYQDAYAYFGSIEKRFGRQTCN